MADDTAAPAPIDAEALQRAIEALQVPQAATQAPSGADEGQSSQGWLGHLLARIGNAEAGGPTGLLGLTRDQSDTAGLRAMLASGAHMLAASGPSYTPKDFGTVLASGIEGAMQSRAGSEQSAFTARGAQNALAQQAFQNRIAAIKEAIPLLQLQQRASLPNPFAQGGDGKPGTSIADAAADPVTALPREQALDAIAQRESGGKNVPNAEGGDASGYWQIRDATWRDGAKLAGVDVSKYPRAIDAPKDVQRQVAGAIYDRDGAKPWAASAPGRGVAARTGGTDYAGPGAGGGTTAAPTAPALPLPPEPPAEGIPVPGGSGMRVYPDGKIGTPGQDGRPPATQVATADTGTKTDATPPPAATTPAPGAPRDTTGLKDEELSLPEFQQRYRTPLAPDAGAVKVNPQVQADRQAAVAAAQKSVTQAQAGMRAAEQDWTVQRDDKSLQARSAAQQRLETAQQNLQTAQQNANKLSQDAETETVKNRQAAQQEQDRQLAATYKDLRDRAATAALKTQEGQQQLAQTAAQGEQQRITNKEAVVNAANQKGYDQAVADQHSARNVRAQVQGFRALSDAIEQPGWIQTTKFPGSEQTIAEKLQQAGIKLDDTGAVQLLRGGITNLTRTLREGLPMGALSDRDLSFIERMGPTEWMDRDTRTAATAYLEQAFAAREKFSSIVQKEMARGKNYADAVDVADAQVKPFVPTVPDDLAQHWTDRSPEWTAAKQKWATDNNVRPGSLYDFPDGRLVLAKKPAPAAAPALAVPR